MSWDEEVGKLIVEIIDHWRGYNFPPFSADCSMAEFEKFEAEKPLHLAAMGKAWRALLDANRAEVRPEGWDLYEP